MIWLLFAVLGCGGTQTKESGLVECRGLAQGGYGHRSLISPFQSVHEASGTAQPRCQLMLSDDLTGGDVTLNPGALWDVMLGSADADLGAGWLYANGVSWRIDDGTMSFDTFEDSFAEGTYEFEVTGTDIDVGAVEGRVENNETATFTGPFSWCQSGQDDCPFSFDDGLPLRAAISSPVLSQGEGGATGCRILVDKADQAVQVDLQLGSWNGINVDQYWVIECGAAGTFPPQNNYLTFRAGGVTGPGSYGPQTSYVLDGHRLPGLFWEHPAVWHSGIQAASACPMFYWRTAVAQNLDGSVCSFEIDAAGTFTLECSDVLHEVPGSYDYPRETGAFSLTADCDYVER